jgi:hypothetical protein
VHVDRTSGDARRTQEIAEMIMQDCWNAIRGRCARAELSRLNWVRSVLQLVVFVCFDLVGRDRAPFRTGSTSVAYKDSSGITVSLPGIVRNLKCSKGDVTATEV